ncbi:hypothetical protein D9Q98_000166 [Chlorella vulgaris]|uniref:Uncharacterized protein n=1 Tax=Chlorella vulgaris TaxID=3077 RepID=A0A9D4TXP8_CHLVU|nr:hypothetical protein D9Q98_000166 [Chlorella vulgaris]
MAALQEARNLRDGAEGPACSPGDQTLAVRGSCTPPASGQPAEHQTANAMLPPPAKTSGVLSPLCGSAATSSQVDTLIAPPSRLLTSEAGTEITDEYLMRMLTKCAPPQPAPAARPPLPAHPLAQQQQQQQQPAAMQQQQQTLQQQRAAKNDGGGFRAPGPVRRPSNNSPSRASAALPSGAGGVQQPSPRRQSACQASASLPCASGATAPSMLGSQPSTTATATTDQALPSSLASSDKQHVRRLSRSGRGSGNEGGPNPLAAGGGDGGRPDSFAATRQRLGDETAFGVRNTMIRQQVVFLEQLYDLHRAIAIQKLLMQNCPEVQQVMGEAMRLMSSVGSQHGSGSGRASKRGQRTTPNGGDGTAPGSLSGDPSSFRPDSQFAAVPQLPCQAVTAGGSGDEDEGGSGDANGSGSGQNGSGGGSTSPQHLGALGNAPLPTPIPYQHLTHTAVATPSGTSVAPNAAWQWGPAAPGALPLPQQQEQQQAAPPEARGLPPVPQGPPQMAPWVGQDAGLAAADHPAHPAPQAPAAPEDAAAPAAAAAAAPPAAAVAAAPAAAAAAPLSLPAAPAPLPPSPFGAHGGAPLLGPGSLMRAGVGLPPGMGLPPGIGMPPAFGMPLPAVDPLSWWYQNYYGAPAGGFQHAPHAQAQQMGGLSLATAQAAAAAAAALMPPPPPHSSAANGGTTTYTGGTFTAPTATATKWWTDPNLTFGPAVDTDMLTRRAAGARTASLANGREGLEVQSGGMSSKRSAQAAPEAQRRGSLYSEGRRHLKRKAAVAVDADEASSGTTGHALGSHDIDAGVVSYKRQESARPRGGRAAHSGERASSPGAANFPATDEKAAALLLAIGGKK